MSTSVARGWIDGVTALPGMDEEAETAYFILNLPPSRARTIYGRVRAEIAAGAQATLDAVARRRPTMRGHVRKRGNKWCAVVDGARDRDGRRKQHQPGSRRSPRSRSTS